MITPEIHSHYKLNVIPQADDDIHPSFNTIVRESFNKPHYDAVITDGLRRYSEITIDFSEENDAQRHIDSDGYYSDQFDKWYHEGSDRAPDMEFLLARLIIDGDLPAGRYVMNIWW